MVEQQVRTIFASVYAIDRPAEGIDLDEPLFGPESAFGLDSLDTLRFIAALQDAYRFDVGACGTDTFRTIRSISDFVAA
ncbi:acyl carrier protein [Solwaraspora sp. WMMD1047]|uniref:acyl carrier protein n=1 Tax=Solwaraspora sp. WMMD1047 TaxID=3016102 RepID=UPI002417C67C|nr:acyl carrier protein [Solwaraspora sp. WMMD1047]MDG4830821.1 acyl carrier protein [Solwaraspora sp. WMMD1047]